MQKKTFALLLAVLLAAAFALSACAADVPSADGSSGGESKAEKPAAHEAVPDGAGQEATDIAPAEEAENAAEALPPGRGGSAAADDLGSYSRYSSDLPQQKEAGVLTAGRQQDREDWEEFVSVLNRPDWRQYQNFWGLFPASRISVTASSGKKPLPGVRITGYDHDGTVLWKSMTDNRGETDVFTSFFGGQAQLAYVEAEYADNNNAASRQRIDMRQESSVHFDFPEAPSAEQPKALDLMLVMDTTGSMGDELEYLKTELTDVVDRVLRTHEGLGIRTSVNFYRDEDDEYVVRSYDFTGNPSESYQQMAEQYADGGGDYAEALDQALSDAVKDHAWEAPVRLLFLVLDAPPHNIGDNYVLKNAVTHAAADGIRIIPIASSGVDEETEFLLRTIAASTGGQYVFLTDDSDVGNDHKEPTVSDYETEYLNDLMVDIIDEYLKTYPTIRERP